MAEAIDAIVTQQPGSKTYRVMTAVAYYAGLRPSEVVMLRVRSATLPTDGWGRLEVTTSPDPKCNDRLVTFVGTFPRFPRALPTLFAKHQVRAWL